MCACACLENKNKKTYRIIAFLLFVICFITIALSINFKGVGITWDEPIGYFYGAELVIKWGGDVYSHIKNGDIGSIFSKEFIDKYWELPTTETSKIDHPNNHPPFTRYMSALFWLLFNPFFSDIVCYRLSSAFLFSILITCLFLLISEYYGAMTGLFASLSLMLMPRLFAHAHIAASDIPITTLWFLSVFFYWRALSSNKYALPFSITFGLALITKFQAIIIPIPLIIYSLLYERQRIKVLLKIGFTTLIISPILMIGMNPTWWHHPIQRIYYNHIILGLNHSKNLPIAKYYFGKKFFYKRPWHMPLIMILITTPVTILISFGLGLSHIIRKRLNEKLPAYFIINLCFGLGIMILPTINSYDGVRHFLIIFPFIAAISGIGFKWLAEKIILLLKRTTISYKTKNINFKVFLFLFIVLLIGPLSNIIAIHPYELAYYNKLIGGIKGANEMGMETTYWFDVVNEEFLDYINLNLPPNAKIYMWPPNLIHFIYLQQKDYLRGDFIFTEKDYDYLILIHRQGTFPDWVWKVYQNCPSVYSLLIDDVPLISLYKRSIPCR